LICLKGDLDDFELEEFFEDTMNNEFNTVLEDNSAVVMARLLLKYNQMYRKGNHAELNEELLKKFPQNKTSSTVSSSIKFKDQNQPEEDVINIYLIAISSFTITYLSLIVV
jgi:hypothetical protein